MAHDCVCSSGPDCEPPALRICPQAILVSLRQNVQEKAECKTPETLFSTHSNEAQIKPLAPLRSSDRRKIADQIIADYKIEVPRNDELGTEKDEQTSQASALGAFRNALLPENALSARFMTTAGPNLSPVSGTVYVGSYEGAEQRILWFKMEERFLPTGVPDSHGSFAA